MRWFADRRGRTTPVKDQSPKARFIHASAYASYLPAHATMIAETKAPRMARMVAWLAPHVYRTLTEMLLIDLVAELSRRWLNGAEMDLPRAARLLAPRIWSALRAHELSTAARLSTVKINNTTPVTPHR